MLSTIVCVSILPALALAQEFGLPVTCKATYISDSSLYDLGPRTVCLCSDLGCGQLEIAFEPGPVLSISALGNSGTARRHENNVWIMETPNIAENVKILSQKESGYVIHRVCTALQDVTAVEFADKTVATKELRNEIRRKLNVKIYDQFLMDC